MQDFAPATYMKLVLAPYAKGGTPDPFERYLLDLDDDDDDRIDERMEDVLRWWNNNKTQGPPVGPLIAGFIKEHAAIEGKLGDRTERRALAAELRESRSKLELARYEGVDVALDQLHRAHGGIPADRWPQVVEIGLKAGLQADAVERHIRAVMHREGWSEVTVAVASSVDPLPAGDADRLTQHLRRFADTRRRDQGNEEPVRSLFDVFPGIQLEADAAACAASIAAFENELRQHVKGASDLAAAMRTVIEDGRAHITQPAALERYRATVVREAMGRMEEKFLAYSIDHVISADEHLKLLTQAAELGLTDRYAREAVDGLFRQALERGELVEKVVGGSVTFILCATCRTPARLEQGHANCLSCGDPLYRVCPACKANAPRSEAVCRTCSHSMVAALRFDSELRQARAALNGGRPIQAQRRVASALQLEPESADAKALQAEVQIVVTEAARAWQAVAVCDRDRRLYAGRGLLRSLCDTAIDAEGPSGDLPGEAFTRLKDEIKGVEDRLSRAREVSDPAARERLFADILTQARDCSEAQRELARIAPASPGDVRVALLAVGVEVGWSPSASPGVTGYAVVRGGRRAPSTRTAGTLVAELADPAQTRVTDTSVSAGETVAYAVFALRAGATSTGCASAPIVVALEAADVVASVDSGEVRLSWRLPSPQAGVEVERQSPDGQSNPVSAGPDGLVDAGLANGTTYRYTVRLRYGPVLTEGVVVLAAPAEPPRLVALTSLESAADGVVVRWKEPESGSVVICRSHDAIDLEPGTEVRRAGLVALGRLLPGRAGSATDPTARDGSWYTPFTVAGDRAVAGSGLRWSDIPAVTDVKALAAGAEVDVTWAWPPSVTHAVVVWREGQAPTGPEDPDARRQHVTRAIHQEVNAGTFRIARERAGEALRLVVYAARMRDGELIVGGRLSPSSRVGLDPAVVKAAIRYELTVRRSLRGKSLDLRLSGMEPYPEVVLIAKPGDIIPLASSDGQQVARLGGDGAPSEISLPLRSLPPSRPLAVRAFLAADSARARFALKEPADLTSLVLR